eukprot:gene419-689_t
MDLLGVVWPPPQNELDKATLPEAEKRLAIAIKAAEKSGEIIKAAGDEGRNAIAKDGVDLVTATDTASEKSIKDIISEALPSDDFIGEEEAAAGKKVEMSENWTWIIDPIDGTTNFVHDFPFYSVSIAVAYKKTFVIGVILDPATGDLYSAMLGKGAYRNKEKLSCKQSGSLGEALINNNIGKSRDPAFIKKTLSRLGCLMSKGVRGLRNVGGAAMAMAYVARGSFDCFFEDGFGGPWDIAAGSVLVHEAGGVCLDIHGGPQKVSAGAGRIIAGGKTVCEEMGKLFKEVDELLEAA